MDSIQHGNRRGFQPTAIATMNRIRRAATFVTRSTLHRHDGNAHQQCQFHCVAAAFAGGFRHGNDSNSNGSNISIIIRNMASLSSCFSWRGMASSSSNSKTDDILMQVLDTEIKFALATDPPDEESAPPGTIPFRIEDNPGKQVIVLRRKFGEEDVKVEVLSMDIGASGVEASDNDSYDGGVEYAGKPSVVLIVTVSKPKSKQCLEISCIADRDDIHIEYVVAKDISCQRNKAPTDRLLYGSVFFSSLDKDLKKSFIRFLQLRGITPDLSGFLAEYMMNKESKEYTRWLQNVRWFVEKKD